MCAEGVGLNLRRTALLDVLRRMGARVQIERTSAPTDPEVYGNVTVTGAELKGTAVGGEEIPNLIDELPRMQRMGVAVARISPQAQHTSEIVALFDAVRRGALAPHDARAQLQPLVPDQSCNGYWHGQPGLDLVETQELAPA